MAIPQKSLFFSLICDINHKKMKNIRFGVILHLTLLLGVTAVSAQQTPTNASGNAVSKYDYHDAFAPHF